MGNSKSNCQNSSSKLPPRPWKLPVIGHLHHLLTDLPHRSLRDLAKIHGPLMLLQLGEVDAIIVSSPRLAKEVMQTHDLVFADRPPILAAEIVSYGCNGVAFSPYGEYWMHMRQICIKELLNDNKAKSFWSIRQEEVSNLIESLCSVVGTPVNLTWILFSLSNDTTSRALFGKKCKDRDVFLSLQQEMLILGGGFFVEDLFPSFKFLHGIFGAKLKLEKIRQGFDNILDNIISEHKEKRTNHETDEGELKEDLVDVLLRLQQDNDPNLQIGDDNIKAVLLDLLSARTESSSITIEWAMSEMMRNPRIMEKAQTEVRYLLNGKTNIQQSDVNELKYLKLVIKETMRLHLPNAMMTPRESREQCNIDGYEIPEGTRVLINAWGMARDPEYWTDPEIFEPERFENLSVEYNGTSHEFIPFGAGRRMCPGISFAIGNIELPLAQLLYHFEWKLPNGLKPEELDMTEVFGATIRKKVSLYLTPTPYSP